ncbi:MAG: PTS sugar transporter subunit IIA [Ignavibacteriales bacterium]
MNNPVEFGPHLVLMPGDVRTPAVGDRDGAGYRARETLLSQMADSLDRAGAVKAGFLQALMDREKEFPTGLQAEGLGFAIPHADARFVNHSAICLAIPASPVPFGRMDDPSQTVPAGIIVMMAVNDPEGQLEMLQGLAGSFADAVFWSGVRRMGSREEVARAVGSRLFHA